MGHYTRLETDFTVRKDSLPTILPVLLFMLHRDKRLSGEKPDHPLFRTERWDIMLVAGSGGSNWDPEHTLSPVLEGLNIKSISEFKNYEDEVAKFADWIRPHLIEQTRRFLFSHSDGHWERQYFTYGRAQERFNSIYDDENSPRTLRWTEIVWK